MRTYGFSVHLQSRPSWARGLKCFAVWRRNGQGKSRPSWARGLKSSLIFYGRDFRAVAPLVGAWIEICEERKTKNDEHGRAPRGRVD